MDHQEKLATLRKVKEQFRIDLPEDVSQLILECADTEEELRDLALKTSMRASLESRPLTVEVVKEVVGEAKGTQRQRPDHPHQINSLFEAIEAGDLESMRDFLRQGGDLEEISDERWGFTPLLVAAELRNHQAMKVLLEAGANPNYEGETGSSPVHLAIADLECLKIILEAGGDPNLEGEDYITPLMLIRKNEDLPKALMLLKAGADPTKVAREGVTALGVAEQYGADAVAQELRSWIEKGND